MRRGGQFDPDVVDAFLADPTAVLARPGGPSPWDAALAEAPDRDRPLTPAELDRMFIALGDFVDLNARSRSAIHERSPISPRRRPAPGPRCGRVAAVRRAGHVHDIGRIGCSNRIWEYAGELSAEQWERVRLHPYLTGRILERVNGLADVRGSR